MCYKDEVQRKNEEKLQRKLKEDNVPTLITRYFINIRSKAGALNYWIAIKDLLIWLIEQKIIKKNISEILLEDFYNIYPEDITSYLDQKEKNGMSPTTLETRKNIFRSFWKYLARQRKSEIDPNFFKDVSYEGIASGDNLIKKFPSDEQLKLMEEKINSKKEEYIRKRNLCVLQILKGTGLRESELAGLDITNLFLDEEMPYIRIIGKGKYRERESRIVFLTGSALEAIKEWMDYRKTLTNIVDNNSIFLNKNGKRMTEYNIQCIFRTYGNGVTPHMVRHWFATIMANTGNLAFAQQQLGHKTANITTNSYINGAYGMKDILMSM